MKNKIYTFIVDSNLDETLKKFENQLTENEEIISSSITDGRLIVFVKENKAGKTKKLLLE
jgi:hypothetical protein